MNTEILTQNGVDLASSLENLGDMDMYNEIAQDFLTESETRIPNIQNYYASEDLVNYEVLVHAMKSDSKYLGFTKLAELSYSHELASKENNLTFVKENYNELMEEANRIINLLHQYLEG